MSVLGMVLFYRCLLIFNLNRPFEGAEMNRIYCVYGLFLLYIWKVFEILPRIYILCCFMKFLSYPKALVRVCNRLSKDWIDYWLLSIKATSATIILNIWKEVKCWDQVKSCLTSSIWFSAQEFLSWRFPRIEMKALEAWGMLQSEVQSVVFQDETVQLLRTSRRRIGYMHFLYSLVLKLPNNNWIIKQLIRSVLKCFIYTVI
jgi:hypothetical protein